MRWLATAEQSRSLDQTAIVDWGLPSTSLMEAAALRLAEVVRDQGRGRIVVITGAGNNGGDGWAAARWLHGWGCDVAVWSIKDPSGGDGAVMRNAALACGVSEASSVDGADVIVDALFGTGLSRPVQGRFAEAIAAINASPAVVVSADLPSGLDADTGQVLGCAVHADTTVTFAVAKPALVAGAGRAHAGDWHIADIGLLGAVSDVLAELPDAEDIAPLWPTRDPGSHKTRSGQLLVIAGSLRMAGASILTCRAALAAGAGMVTLCTPHSALVRLGGLPPEVMVLPCGDDALGDVSTLDLDRYTAIAAGPGLGDLPSASQNALRDLWRRAEVPVVFDADAIQYCAGAGAGPRVMTPHPGEASRFLGIDVAAIEFDRFGAVRRLTETGVTALLKGPYTLVASPERRISVNTTGNAVLSTGGTGDVLTGVIAALLCRDVTAHDAACAGAFVHGLAADVLASERPVGWTAGDVADALPDAITKVRASDPGSRTA